MLPSDRVREICQEAWDHARETPFPIGNSHWIEAFSGYVKMKIDEDFKDIKRITDELTKLIDTEDPFDK